MVKYFYERKKQKIIRTLQANNKQLLLKSYTVKIICSLKTQFHIVACNSFHNQELKSETMLRVINLDAHIVLTLITIEC